MGACLLWAVICNAALDQATDHGLPYVLWFGVSNAMHFVAISHKLTS